MKSLLAASFVFSCCALAAGPPEDGAKRLVVIKVDGLPGDMIEQQLQSGKLPWINRVFRRDGTWVKNFYVRGISLSAPSWSMLDTGEHLIIRGNAEFDRSYARVYDYLNFFPWYVEYARLQRADMPGVEVLDQAGISLLLDRFPPQARYQGAQLYQRGVRWETLKASLANRIARPVKDLISELETGGLEFSEGIAKQQEKELLAALGDPKIRYLDYFFGDYDHVAHLTNDPVSQGIVLRRLDGLVGRIWTAIEGTSLSRQTVLVMVSDHGMNSDPKVYSQGYNLVHYFGSAAGGGHHAVTTRHPLTDYKLRGLDPFVSWVVTESRDSRYLRGRDDYPTALIDLDGNERASVQLRNSDWNALQMLFENRSYDGIGAIIERHRDAWTKSVAELKEELAALERAIARQREAVAQDPKKWTEEDHKSGKTLEARRGLAFLNLSQRDDQGYGDYLRTLERLLAWKTGDPPVTIPRGVMGDRNTLEDLRNYVVGPAGGKSGPEPFERINYLQALTDIRVNHSVQKELPANPIDFIAVRLGDQQVLLYQSEAQQSVLSAEQRQGKLYLSYKPVSGVWRDGLPLHLFEDPKLCVPDDRTAWLNRWHPEEEWFQAIYATRYSNAVIGLAEHFREWVPAGVPPPFRIAPEGDWELLRRFSKRKWRNSEADLLLLASGHWNFNVRGFNPGGNHGSFFQISTHSVLMLAGAGVPHGLAVEKPYDSLSFVPTLLSLTGNLVPAAYPGEPIPLASSPQ